MGVKGLEWCLLERDRREWYWRWTGGIIKLEKLEVYQTQRQVASKKRTVSLNSNLMTLKFLRILLSRMTFPNLNLIQRRENDPLHGETML
jgi:hypothetical protein